MQKNSTFKSKLAANKKFKADIFSLSGLQRYAISVFENKTDNQDFINLCNDLGLTVEDMKFEHVLNYGKVKELNKIDRKTNKVIEKKSLFSFWVFVSCLERYRNANPLTVPAEVEKVNIQEKKTSKRNISKTKKAGKNVAPAKKAA